MVLLNGLPVMFGASIAHLTLLNVIVIVIEGFLLAKVLKKYAIEFKLRSVVIANIISAVCGVVIAPYVSDGLLNGNFFGRSFSTFEDYFPFYAGLAAFIVFTILIEGVVYYGFYKKHLPFKKLIVASLWINLLTNILITANYIFMKANQVY
jgi:hypothetical protein